MLHTQTFARALYALHEAGVLADAACKPAVKTLIRQVSEDSQWHCSAHYRSKEAAAAIRAAKPKTKAQYQAFCRKNLRHEHMVPCGVVYQLLINLKNPTVEDIAKLLECTSHRATITKNEDKQLLRHSMPTPLGDPEQGEYPDHLARYKHAAGLDHQLEPRPADGWI